MVSNNEFELVFNIDAKNKIYFGDLSLDLPIEFDETNFKSLNNLFLKIKGSAYSINTIQEILNEIDVITINEQYESIKAEVVESVSEKK